jgi:hypothetical protein
MIKILASVVVAVVITCSCTDNSSKADFAEYIKNVEEIKLPIQLNSSSFVGSVNYQKYRKDLFKRFAPQHAYELYGRIILNRKFVSLIFNAVGDINKPIIMTYDLDGNRIDSLNLFPNACNNYSGFIAETAYLSSDRNIKIIDSIGVWDLKSNDWKIKDLGLDSIKILISNSGKFIKK